MGKNKRKYDGEPPKAQEVTKRNLSKLRKLSKPEHPLAAVSLIFLFSGLYQKLSKFL